MSSFFGGMRRSSKFNNELSVTFSNYEVFCFRYLGYKAAREVIFLRALQTCLRYVWCYLLWQAQKSSVYQRTYKLNVVALNLQIPGSEVKFYIQLLGCFNKIYREHFPAHVLENCQHTEWGVFGQCLQQRDAGTSGWKWSLHRYLLNLTPLPKLQRGNSVHLGSVFHKCALKCR